VGEQGSEGGGQGSRLRASPGMYSQPACGARVKLTHLHRKLALVLQQAKHHQRRHRLLARGRHALQHPRRDVCGHPRHLQLHIGASWHAVGVPRCARFAGSLLGPLVRPAQAQQAQHRVSDSGAHPGISRCPPCRCSVQPCQLGSPHSRPRPPLQSPISWHHPTLPSTSQLTCGSSRMQTRAHSRAAGSLAGPRGRCGSS
jgi:hypothetical protein